jgi:hypothetical protein
MIIAKAKLSSEALYQQGKYVQVEKKARETHKDYEERTWRERCHYTPEDEGVYIPAIAFKKCLESSARFNSRQIPGKGKQTYTKHFVSGVAVLQDVPLPITKSTIIPDRQFVPSDGKSGGGKRVEKIFPTVHNWEGEVQFIINDHTITEDVFTDVLEDAGKFIGIGVWRPENSGMNGRFSVDSVDWQELD